MKSYRFIKRKIKNILTNQRKYSKIFKIMNNYTMIPENIYINNLKLAHRFELVKGCVVECGTWKGGMIAGIGMLFKEKKQYFLFDSFEGLPPAKEIDGVRAKKWQQDVDSDYFFDNCRASENDAIKAMEIADLRDYNIYKGWFNNTLKSKHFENGISILRMDADWYDSTYEILDKLFNQVNKGGLIIIDDYYTWEGCTKAVHDYLSINKLAEKIRSYNSICFIIKE